MVSGTVTVLVTFSKSSGESLVSSSPAWLDERCELAELDCDSNSFPNFSTNIVEIVGDINIYGNMICIIIYQ